MAILPLLSLCIQAQAHFAFFDSYLVSAVSVLVQAEEALNSTYGACISLRLKSNPLC